MLLGDNTVMERSLWQALSTHTHDLIFAKDLDGRFIYVNAALARISGIDVPAAMLGKTDYDFYPADLAQRFCEDDHIVMVTGESLVDREEQLYVPSGGNQGWYSTTKIPLLDDTGAVIGILGIARDITAGKQAETEAQRLNVELDTRVAERTAELQRLATALANERNLMRTLVDSVPDNIFTKDIESRFLLANPSVARCMGTTIEDLLGKTDFDFYPREMAERFFNDEQQLLKTGEPLLGYEEQVVDKVSGKLCWFLTSKLPVRDNDGKVIGLVGIGRDITERKTTLERVEHLATHDGLTGLPNRVMYSELLNKALEYARRYQRRLAVLFVDLDRFKEINDTFGHDAGDALLTKISQRFSKVLRASDVVARLGGDEFVILLQEVDGAEQVAIAAQKILAAAIEPVEIEQQLCCVTASIGIALYPEHGQDKKLLLMNADIAMYSAKKKGKNTYEFFTTEGV